MSKQDKNIQLTKYEYFCAMSGMFVFGIVVGLGLASCLLILLSDNN